MNKQPTCKRTTNKPNITHEGVEYSINNSGNRNLTLFTSQLHKLISQLTATNQKWGRVLMIRFDLHLPYETPDNKIMTTFRNKLFKKLKRRYSLDEIGFAWAREQHNDSKGLHYHWVILLNANVVRHPANIVPLIHQTFFHPVGGFTAHFEPQHYKLIDSIDSLHDAVFWASYLAKTRGKGYRAKMTHDFATSRIKLN